MIILDRIVAFHILRKKTGRQCLINTHDSSRLRNERDEELAHTPNCGGNNEVKIVF